MRSSPAYHWCATTCRLPAGTSRGAASAVARRWCCCTAATVRGRTGHATSPRCRGTSGSASPTCPATAIRHHRQRPRWLRWWRPRSTRSTPGSAPTHRSHWPASRSAAWWPHSWRHAARQCRHWRCSARPAMAARAGPRAHLHAWRDAFERHDEPALRDTMRHNLQMHMLAGEADDIALAIHTEACLRTRFFSKRISRAGGWPRCWGRSTSRCCCCGASPRQTAPARRAQERCRA
jgi:hypothetical protein